MNMLDGLLHIDISTAHVVVAASFASKPNGSDPLYIHTRKSHRSKWVQKLGFQIENFFNADYNINCCLRYLRFIAWKK